jgi:hypothetical protein
MKRIEKTSKGIHIFAISQLIIGIVIFILSMPNFKGLFGNPDRSFISFILIITFIVLLLIGGGLGFLLRLRISRMISVIAYIFIIVVIVSLAAINIISTARQYDDIPFNVLFRLLDYRFLILALFLNIFPVAGLIYLKKMKL